MKFYLSLKTPDVAQYILEDMTGAERKEVLDSGVINKFVEDEYIQVEMDTETKTAKILAHDDVID